MGNCCVSSTNSTNVLPRKTKNNRNSTSTEIMTTTDHNSVELPKDPEELKKFQKNHFKQKQAPITEFKIERKDSIGQAAKENTHIILKKTNSTEQEEEHCHMFGQAEQNLPAMSFGNEEAPIDQSEQELQQAPVSFQNKETFESQQDEAYQHNGLRNNSFSALEMEVIEEDNDELRQTGVLGIEHQDHFGEEENNGVAVTGGTDNHFDK